MKKNNEAFKHYCDLVRNGSPADPAVVRKVNNLYDKLGDSHRERKIKTLYDSFRNILKELGYVEGDVAELTPHRAAYGYLELLSGADEYKKIEWRTFKTNCKNSQLIIVKDISFFSFCEHHILPFWGSATIAYLPKDKLLGLDKIPKLVNAVAHGLQLQERITNQIADIINEKAEPLGVGVMVKAKHMCISARGVQSDCLTQTLAFRGILNTKVYYQKLLVNS